MADQDQTPKIQIDSDWKAQARAEKERLAQQSKPAATPAPGSTPGSTPGSIGAAGTTAGTAAAGARSRARGEMPPASIETLINTFATQALFAMGAIPDPRTGQRIQHMDLARHHIDMLTVLEEKTKGNLTTDETNTLAATLYELRSRYVQMAAAARPV